MKKFIALVLALLTIFSVSTIAFAEGEADAPVDTETTTLPAEESDLGDLDWLLDLPFWTVGPAFKLAKIALKLVKVFVKIASVFGMDVGDIVELIEQKINDSAQGEVETTAAAVLA